MVAADLTTREDCTPGLLKASMMGVDKVRSYSCPRLLATWLVPDRQSTRRPITPELVGISSIGIEPKL